MSDTLQIIAWPDPALLKPAEEIRLVTPEIEELAEMMVQTMYSASGIGLAANQVGESLRLAVMDLSLPEEENNLIILVNPQIVHAEGKEIMDEGCLSLPGFRADVPRASHVVVRGYDLKGKPVEIEREGFFARVLQHEIDHLSGKLFPDRLSRLKKNLTYQKVRKAIKRGEFGKSSD